MEYWFGNVLCCYATQKHDFFIQNFIFFFSFGSFGVNLMEKAIGSSLKAIKATEKPYTYWSPVPPQFLADQLSLSQPTGTIGPPDFQTLIRVISDSL